MDTLPFRIWLLITYIYDEHSKDSYFINETYFLNGNQLRHMKEEKGRKRSPRQTTETIVEEAVLQKIYQLLQKESLPEKLDYMGEIAKDATICSTRLTIKIIEKEGEKNYSVSLTGEHEDVSGHDAYRAIMRLKNIFE